MPVPAGHGRPRSSGACGWRAFQAPGGAAIADAKRLYQDAAIAEFERARLPLLWDMDFIPGEPSPDGTPSYVLCEINVSSVSPFPPSAIAPLVAAVKRRVHDRA